MDTYERQNSDQGQHRHTASQTQDRFKYMLITSNNAFHEDSGENQTISPHDILTLSKAELKVNQIK